MSCWLGPRIDVRDSYPPLLAEFTRTLTSFAAAEWELPTVCPGWSVKDVTAHVVGDHVSRLSRHRDGYSAGGPAGDETLAGFIDRVNAEWVIAARRMSPRVLTSWFTAVADEIVALWQAADLDAVGEPVSWAGPEPAPAWLDAARDFTEIWTHYQQICDAVGRPGAAEYAVIVLDTFMRALPHTLRPFAAPPGTTVVVVVPGAGSWACGRDPDRWRLAAGGADVAPAARIELDADTAWRLCTRGLLPSQAIPRARIYGDRTLAEAALQIVSIIWAHATR